MSRRVGSTFQQQRIALLLLIGLGVGGCVSSESRVANVHTVVPGVLVRGGQPDERGFRQLEADYGVRSVVNLNGRTAKREGPIVGRLGMTYFALPSSAWSPDAEKVLTFLHEVRSLSAHGAVFVHCLHGMDRTGLAVAAYRVVVQDWDADRAVRELRSMQAFPHAEMFPKIPRLVRKIYRDRLAWRARLKGMQRQPTTEPVDQRTSRPSPSI